MKNYLLILLSLLPAVSFANQFYGYLGWGVSQSFANRSNPTAVMQPTTTSDPKYATTYIYKQKPQSRVLPSFNLGFGMSFPALFGASWSPKQAVEISYNQQSAELNGDTQEWAWVQASGSSASTYEDTHQVGFHYKINSHVLFANYLIYLPNWQKFMPYVEVGLGLAQLHTHFSGGCAAKSDGCAPGDKQYMSNKRNTNLAYDLGFGVRKQLNHNTSFGIKYLLTDFGQVRSGSGEITNSTGKPPVSAVVPRFKNHLYSQALTVSLIRSF